VLRSLRVPAEVELRIGSGSPSRYVGITTFSSHTRTAPDFVAVGAVAADGGVRREEFTAAGFAAAPASSALRQHNSRDIRQTGHQNNSRTVHSSLHGHSPNEYENLSDWNVKLSPKQI